jgi:hypothetical protein
MLSQTEEELEWINHIYCHVHTHGINVPAEIDDYVTAKRKFMDEFKQTMIDKKNAIEEDKPAITQIQVDMMGAFYDYLLTVPLVMYLYPNHKNDYMNATDTFIPQIEGFSHIDKDIKNTAVWTLRKFCTMCKYLDCLSWYNTNPVETPSEDTLRHYTNLISNPDYYDMMFSKEKRESPIYHMVYDTASKKVVKAVFHDGPHILEVPPQGFTFGKCKILYDNDENVFIIRPAFLD